MGSSREYTLLHTSIFPESLLTCLVIWSPDSGAVYSKTWKHSHILFNHLLAEPPLTEGKSDSFQPYWSNESQKFQQTLVLYPETLEEYHFCYQFIFSLNKRLANRDALHQLANRCGTIPAQQSPPQQPCGSTINSVDRRGSSATSRSTKQNK